MQQTRLAYEKARERDHKAMKDDEDKKTKDSMKVMAKIAFKEWKERKGDEAREEKE